MRNAVANLREQRRRKKHKLLLELPLASRFELSGKKGHGRDASEHKQTEKKNTKMKQSKSANKRAQQTHALAQPTNGTEKGFFFLHKLDSVHRDIVPTFNGDDKRRISTKPLQRNACRRLENRLQLFSAYEPKWNVQQPKKKNRRRRKKSTKKNEKLSSATRKRFG